MGEPFPVTTRSAFCCDLLALASANYKVRSAGSRAGDGETFRGEEFSLDGKEERKLFAPSFFASTSSSSS